MTRTASSTSRLTAWSLALCMALVLACGSTVRAEDIAPYVDERDSNYLKVLYRFAYPVGKVAEVFIFRPIHAFAGATGQPDPDMRREDDDLGACLTFRPMRKCGRD
jgi:hypothetical protein